MAAARGRAPVGAEALALLGLGAALPALAALGHFAVAEDPEDLRAPLRPREAHGGAVSRRQLSLLLKWSYGEFITMEFYHMFIDFICLY